MCACVVHALGIDPSQWRWFPVPISSASDDDDPPVKKLCVFLCRPQNTPECSSEHLKLPKFVGGACPQTPVE